MKKLSSLSVVFPAYNDEHAIPLLITKISSLLPDLAKEYEIVVVNDGSKDNTANVLNEIKKHTRSLRIITHEVNQGYGATLFDGFTAASKEFIFYTDGDGQYDVSELAKLVARMDDTVDMVTGFKLSRSDPWYRMVIGAVYNGFLKIALQLPVKDIDCDFRLFRKSILSGLSLTIKSGTFDAQFLSQLAAKKIRIREVGVHHYERKFGHSQFFSPKHLGKSLLDLGKIFLQRYA